MKAIELVLDHHCNASCAFCFVPCEQAGHSFSTQQALSVLASSYQQGARTVFFGGGEPTLRKDLKVLVSAARTIGYDQVTLKTNAIRLCSPERVEQLCAAGVTSFSVPVWGDRYVHNALSGVADAYERSEMAIKHMLDSSAAVELDVLITRSALPSLAATIEHFAALGIKEIFLWYLSLFGMAEAGGRLRHELPSFREAMPFVREAFRAGMRAGVRTLLTSQIPPCVLGDMRKYWYTLCSLDLLIVTPGNSFRAEDSPFEGGMRLPVCERCSFSSSCLGVRKDYLDIYGPEEFSSVTGRGRA